MRSGELCTREVVTAREHEPLRDVARRMTDLHVGCLVVVEPVDDGRVRPIGIVTDRDLVRVVALGEVGHARELQTGDVMSRELLVGREDEPAFEALDRMRTRGVRRLPIVDAQQCLLGLLTMDDLLEWISGGLTDLVRLVAREQHNERAERKRPTGSVVGTSGAAATRAPSRESP
jgi:CBS-domain-containing membrane protein